MAAATVLLVDGAALREHGPWVGFNRYLLLTIGLGALGGIAVSFVFRFADNILKSFAVGCSIALNCVRRAAAPALAEHATSGARPRPCMHG